MCVTLFVNYHLEYEWEAHMQDPTDHLGVHLADIAQGTRDSSTSTLDLGLEKPKGCIHTCFWLGTVDFGS